MRVPIKIGSTTLVGVLRESFPLQHGNCFDMIVDEKGYHVANMYYENLEHLIETLGLKDLEIEIILEPELHRRGTLLVKDSRVPDDYLHNNICSTCLGSERANDVRKKLGLPEVEEKDMWVIESSDSKKLRLEWTITELPGICIINDSAIEAINKIDFEEK